uniref:Uncharacterized protein n=1 Tax=Kalanchoe fedtschenkoi TaxID=63787 RepID=A0A7N1A9G1_KALFE
MVSGLTHMAAVSLCCAIETEPRTLSQGQLNQAREIAGGIANNFEPREAEIIFTKGLRPVNSDKESGLEIISENSRGEWMETTTSIAINQKGRIMEKPCQCALAPPSPEESSTQDQSVQEPYTAPF